jgi:RNA polymerase sigma-70 factor (ECF subfamily)
MLKKKPLQTDEQLARSAANGDRAAFESIVRRYTRPLAEFVIHKTATVQDAEDIVQETFLRAFVNIKTFDPQFSLKNWLFTIAYRLVVSSYRKKKPVRLDSRTCAEMIDPQPNENSQLDWLWEVAAQMGESVYTVLWLRYKQEMEVAEIARVLGRSQIGVRVLLHRARRKLAERIKVAAENQPDNPTFRTVLIEGTTTL